ncbi:hypothetical protein CJ030_MR4G018356 [Morella rubra]|uniref:Uncharacterized protein n=1 Tax=Morella rubra TaxID=262757 RepID=A0A6A1VZY7_9ROSI|nr:hypothetical protein CJ030_MR4G018356 [Morella rubra]
METELLEKALKNQGAMLELGYLRMRTLWYTFDDEDWMCIRTLKNDRDVIELINRVLKAVVGEPEPVIVEKKADVGEPKPDIAEEDSDPDYVLKERSQGILRTNEDNAADIPSEYEDEDDMQT